MDEEISQKLDEIIERLKRVEANQKTGLANQKTGLEKIEDATPDPGIELYGRKS
jgi:hypothetical protein